MPTINTTPEQHRWLQSLVNAQAQKETPSNTTNQGESSIAQSTLMALHELNTGDTVSSLPRLDQVLDPTSDKTFDMGINSLLFSGDVGSVQIQAASVVNKGPGPNFGLIYGPNLGSEGMIYFNSRIGSNHAAWQISSNDEGNDVDEFTVMEGTNGTYKLYLKQGTTGDIYLQQSGGKVGIGVNPVGSPAAKLEVKVSSQNPAPTFSGTGLNDMTTGGIYTGPAAGDNFGVFIDSVGTPDTFTWFSDSSPNVSGIPITGGPQALNKGVTVTFGSTTGHTLNDEWDSNPTAITPLLIKNAAGNSVVSVDNDGHFIIKGLLSVDSGDGSLFIGTSGRAGHSPFSTGIFNVAIGAGALDQVLDGPQNVAIGFNALHSCISGGRNIGIGNSADVDDNLEDAITIGANSHVSQSHTMQLGSPALQNIFTVASVGIGVDPTTTPAAKLEVNGSIKVTGSLTGFNLDKINDPTTDKTFMMGAHSVTFQDGGGNQATFGGGSSNVSTLFLKGGYPFLNIVYGSSSSEEAGVEFQNISGGRFWGLLSNDTSSGAHEFTLLEGTNSTYKVYVKQGTAGDMYLQPSGGNVGIGVSPAGSPAAKLEVNGSLKIDGNLGLFSTTPIAKQTVTGSKGGNVALTSLISALVAYGLITDTTS